MDLLQRKKIAPIRQNNAIKMGANGRYYRCKVVKIKWKYFYQKTFGIARKISYTFRGLLLLIPSMFTPEYVSESEKIDRIYVMLRSQQRARWFSLGIKILLIGGIVYGYHYLTLPENAPIRQKFTESVQAQVSDIAVPIVNSMLQNIQAPGGVTTNRRRAITSPTGQATATMPQITPEMIKAVQDSMKK